jgi:hypothetical protein
MENNRKQNYADSIDSVLLLETFTWNIVQQTINDAFDVEACAVDVCVRRTNGTQM